MAVSPLRPLLFLLLACHAADGSWSGSPFRHAHGGLGVNYGRVADDIPTPRRSVQLLRAAGAGSVKIYDANPPVLRALAGTGMTVSIMVPNQIIPDLAASYAAADRWVADNLLPYLPRTRVKFLLVGNEVLSDASIAASTWPRIVPAMENLHRSLRARRVSRVKLGTTLAMDALVTGAFPRPPSAAAFRPDIAESVLRPLLRFLEGTNSYYFVDAYTYFVWAGSNGTVPLDYALLQAASGARYVDRGRRHVQARPRGRQARHRRDRLAQRRGLRPDRRQRPQRRHLQQEPRGAVGQEPRDAGAAGRQDAGVRLLPLQREPQARPGHRAPLGPLLPQRHGRVPGRPHRAEAAVGVPAAAGGGEQHAVQGPDMVRAGRPRRQEAERDGGGGRADVRVRPGERDVRRHPARRRVLPAQHGRGARQLRLQLLLAAAQEDRSYMLLQQPRRADHQGPKLRIMQVPQFIGMIDFHKGRTWREDSVITF